MSVRQISPVPHKVIGVAVIWNQQGEILIDRRLPYGKMAGLWEFPGGKVEPGETIAACIQREIQEELGIKVDVGEHLITVDHTYTDLQVTLTVHYCQHREGIPQPIECEQLRWVKPEELNNFTFPEANIEIIAAIQQRESGR